MKIGSVELIPRIPDIISAAVAMLALVNPIQKIFLISSLRENLSDAQIRSIITKSTLIAFVTLIVFLAFGNIIFHYVFHIQLYAFRITCGSVLVYSGLMALNKGVIIQIDKNVRIQDISSVPIAIPMIAGPGTITAAVSFPNEYGAAATIAGIVVALGINFLVMLSARHTGQFLIRHNFMSPLLRIIGLIVATIGIQMMSDGVVDFIRVTGV